MKSEVKITEITHTELVNLFSTALFGSSYLEADYNSDFYNSLPNDKKHGDCFEDKLADILLNDGSIVFIDNYSEGEIYSSLGKVVTSEDGFEYGLYSVTLTDILNGLSKAMSGKYGRYVKECANSLVEDSTTFDLCSADALIQGILFDEVIYG